MSCLRSYFKLLPSRPCPGKRLREKDVEGVGTRRGLEA
jgi:hypothetical protein